MLRPVGRAGVKIQRAAGGGWENGYARKWAQRPWGSLEQASSEVWRRAPASKRPVHLRRAAGGRAWPDAGEGVLTRHLGGRPWRLAWRRIILTGPAAAEVAARQPRKYKQVTRFLDVSHWHWGSPTLVLMAVWHAPPARGQSTPRRLVGELLPAAPETRRCARGGNPMAWGAEGRRA